MMGYESTNAISNLGSMFFYLLGLSMAVGFAIVLKVLSKKSERVKKIYTFIADIIFFNVILRMLLEGFMQFYINSALNIYNVIDFFIKFFSYNGDLIVRDLQAFSL